MAQDRAKATRRSLIQAATATIRRQGYTATTIDDICKHAGVTKGAFFHHFKTKEALAEACLEAWDDMAAAMEHAAPFQKMPVPRERVFGYMEFFTDVFTSPETLRSCLAGTTAQEVSDTNPSLRSAANRCFENAEKRFQVLLDEAFRGAGRHIDTASLAALWIATIQGSFILSKASQDPSVIRSNLEHVRRYIVSLLPRGQGKKEGR